MWCRIAFICSIFICETLGAAFLQENNFESCRKEYDRNVGKLVASSGMSVATAVWRISFNTFDLNGNEKISATELVLSLSAEKLVSSENMRRVLSEAQAWIDSAQVRDDNDREISFKEFVDLIGESIGQKQTVQSRRWENVAEAVCVYFNRNIPIVISSIQDLSNCTKFIRDEQIATVASNSGRAAINTWKAAFITLDKNNDMIVTVNEIANALSQYQSSLNRTEKNIERKLAAFIPNKTLKNSEFFKEVTSLLFGSKNSKIWKNVSSLSELEGKKLFCHALRQTHNDIRDGLRNTSQCIASYKETLKRLFKEDSSFASGYIFTLADSNKDGVITSQTFEQLVLDTQHKSVSLDEHYNSSYDQKSFEKMLPDKVVEVKQNDTDTGFELSLLSTNDLRVWNYFCLATIKALESFPSSIDRSSSNEEDSFDSDQADDIAMLRKLERRLAWLQMNDSFEISMNSSFSEASDADSLDEEELVVFTNSSDIDIETDSNIDIETDSDTDNAVVLTALKTSNTTDEPQLNEVEAESPETGNFTQAVDVVLADLNHENDTEAETSNDSQSIATILQRSTGHGSENKAEKKVFLSAEEQELYNLLITFRNNIKHEAKSRSSTEHVALATNKLSLEEQQLRRLLNDVINDDQS